MSREAVLDIELCAKCGGKCCQHHPGIAFPEDFNHDLTEVEKAFQTGKWTMDCWEGDVVEPEQLSRIYFPRPRSSRESGTFNYPFFTAGTCVYLGEKGCEMTVEQRPKMCRLLVPVPGGPCKGDEESGKQEAARLWRPYVKQLEEIGKKYDCNE